jgi:5-methyltetrahydrofolate--homocysteine methyltransferase
MKKLLERLRSGEVLVADGAIGTMLMERGLKAGEPPETFNLTRVEVLKEIAKLYLDAGAELVQTNTFGASPLKLGLYSLQHKTEAINKNAVQAVREAVGESAYICGSCGPTGMLLKPYGDTEHSAVYASFTEQVGTLINTGVDLVCVETMTDLTEAVLAVRAAKAVSPSIPVMATMTFDETSKGFYTVMGVDVARAASALEEAGAEVVGSNCGNGIEKMVEIAKEFREHSKLPIAIQSNAGIPEISDGELRYPETPQFMADKTERLVGLGVSIIGGCCGTTPDHTRAIRETVDSLRSGSS